LVEDNPGDAELLRRTLRQVPRAKFEIAHVERLDEATKRLGAEPYDVLLLDLSLPDSQGLDTVSRACGRAPHIPVVVLTGTDDDALGMAALRRGAQDYLVKGESDGWLLLRSIRYAMERKRAEAALRESEARYRAVVEDQTELICRFLPDGTLTFVNEAYCRYFGREREDLVGRSFLPFIAEEDREVVQEAIASLSPESPVATIEERVLRPGGSVGWQQWTDRGVFDERGSATEFQAVGRDVTDRKQAELKLEEANATLERRVRERTAVAERRATQLRALAVELTHAEQRERRRLAQFLHDQLQQLLVGARFSLGMLRRQLQDTDVLRAVQQVDELLAQSIEASRTLTVELSPPLLYEAGLAHALDWLGRQMREKHGLRVDVAADPDADPADEDVRLFVFQAVRELLFNVVKHAGVGSAQVRVARRDGERVQVVVSDEGVGFDPVPTRTGGEPSGAFGLFSIRERMELLGGWLEMDSAPGKGTRATLSVPLCRAAQPGDRPAASVPLPPPGVYKAVQRPRGPTPAEVGRKIRVLLADDHQLLREGLVGLLAGESDIEVVGEAGDGQTAVELAHRLTPDVVIMDVSMPRLNGVEATRRILAERPGVRVIGLSMHEEAGMAATMRRAGAAAYLTKGGPAEDLVAAIRALAPVDPAGPSPPGW